MEIKEIRSKSPAPGFPAFKFAAITGVDKESKDAEHASWWSFDDEQELRDRWWKPGAGETVLDVGAAFGSYALPALARGARVVAFSPCTFDTKLLELNLGLNPELKRKCLVTRDGLYSKDGWFNPDKSAFGDAPQAGEQWLPVRSLDSFLEERPGIGAIDWIKIDVEGAELEVLRGAEKCLRMYRPRVLVENHEFFHKGIEVAVRDYMVGLGLGYTCDGPHQHCAVSHSFFESRR